MTEAARAGRVLGAVAAAAAGLELVVVDVGGATGNLPDTDPLTRSHVEALVAQGRDVGVSAGVGDLVARGEVGVGNGDRPKRAPTRCVHPAPKLRTLTA